MKIERPKLQFHFDWRASVLVALLLPLLLGLGFWQLDRAEEKRQLQQEFIERQAQAPINITQLLAGPLSPQAIGNRDEQALHHLPVILQGKWLNDHNILLDNRIYQGRFGYEIITPLLIRLNPVAGAGSDKNGGSGESSEQSETAPLDRDDKKSAAWVVLVNRGWQAGDSGRRELPTIAPINSRQAVIGDIYIAAGKGLRLAETPQQTWPKIMQNLDVRMLAKDFEETLWPYEVRLADGQPGVLQRNWVVINISPEKHTAYAVQWFAMALVLLPLFLHLNSNFFSRLTKATNADQ